MSWPVRVAAGLASVPSTGEVTGALSRGRRGAGHADPGNDLSCDQRSDPLDSGGRDPQGLGPVQFFFLRLFACAAAIFRRLSRRRVEPFCLNSQGLRLPCWPPLSNLGSPECRDRLAPAGGRPPVRLSRGAVSCSSRGVLPPSHPFERPFPAEAGAPSDRPTVRACPCDRGRNADLSPTARAKARRRARPFGAPVDCL